MLRLSKLTDYAVVLLTRLGAEGGHQTAPGLAAATGIGEPMVAKVLKVLAHAGLVEGLRGPRGGYRLTRPLSAMPLHDVIFAVDGPVALVACVDDAHGACDAEGICPVRGRWDPVNNAVRAALAAVTLADLAGPNARPRTAHAPAALASQLPEGTPPQRVAAAAVALAAAE